MQWITSEQPVAYEQAIRDMEAHVAAMHSGLAEEQIWLLEHPPLYTAGTSAKSTDLLDKARFPVYQTGRGGKYTYHGPGQRTAYVMLDLKRRAAARGAEPDLRHFVKMLEKWIIASLSELGITGEIRDGRVGVWVRTGQTEKKVAALGIRVRQWISYHGIAINVNPDLSHFAGIVPCGISDYGVTSLHELGVAISLGELDAILKRTFSEIFDRIAA